MKVKSQDGRFYNVTKVFYEAHTYKKLFMGWNIYGTSAKGRKYLLGTMDTDLEASQVTKEINLLMRKGADTYSVPGYPEDYETEVFIQRLEERFR